MPGVSWIGFPLPQPWPLEHPQSGGVYWTLGVVDIRTAPGSSSSTGCEFYLSGVNEGAEDYSAGWEIGYRGPVSISVLNSDPIDRTLTVGAVDALEASMFDHTEVVPAGEGRIITFSPTADLYRIRVSGRAFLINDITANGDPTGFWTNFIGQSEVM